jgi:hypothetical protein
LSEQPGGAVGPDRSRLDGVDGDAAGTYLVGQVAAERAQWLEPSYQGNIEGWRSELDELVAYLDEFVAYLGAT